MMDGMQNTDTEQQQIWHNSKHWLTQICVMLSSVFQHQLFDRNQFNSPILTVTGHFTVLAVPISS